MGFRVEDIQEHNSAACCGFFNSLIETYLFTHHTADPFKVHSSLTFSVFTEVCTVELSQTYGGSRQLIDCVHACICVCVHVYICESVCVPIHVCA